jgi:hypothetical protein
MSCAGGDYHTAATMIDPGSAPLMIGVTGKRHLQGKDAAVRAALVACFDLLDERMPHSPKVLLTGMAEGADMIAAEAALARSDWRVVATLPLSADLFAQDFADAGAGLRKLLAHDRVRARELAPLRDRAGRPLAPGALVRPARGSNPVRTDHYEQAGIFIAERCALLIAVMAADEPLNGIGGTARVVDYRVRGGDVQASGIVQRSAEVRPLDELDSPQTGPVWLIDLDIVDRSPRALLRAVQLWESVPAESGDVVVRKTTRPSAKALVQGARLAVRIDAFNSFGPWASSQPSVAGRASAGGAGDASCPLRRFRLVASAVQAWNKARVNRTLFALASLFVVAVGCLELHIEFESTRALWWYDLLFLAILAVYLEAKGHLYQQYAEDYRAVSEGLRVQLAWWDAGLTDAGHRVDRSYLRGTTGSLALVRAAVRHLIDAVVLDGQVAPPSPARAREWIEGQIGFFARRMRQRRAAMVWFDGLIWFFFMASLGMAVALVALPHDDAEPVGWPLSLLHSSGRVRYLLGAVVVAGLASRLLWRSGKESRFGLRRALLIGLNFAVTFSAGVLLSTAAYKAGVAWSHGDADGAGIIGALVRALVDTRHDAAHKLVAMVTVVTLAMAAALRFLTDRLAWEAELHSYREALGNFVRARDVLARPGMADSHEGRTLLSELGRRALAENESWIRAHRVRPLEPVH